MKGVLLMQIQELFNIDKAIKINDWKEVKSQQIYRSPGVFNSEGLFSEEIFGQTEEERKYTCAYIKLPIHVFNPFIANQYILRSGGVIRKMAYNECRCDLVDGKLVENASGKYTGFKDLFNIWEQIDIRKTLTTTQQDVIDALTKIPKLQLFSDKVMVLPPGMRPIGEKGGRIVKSELNTYYSHLIGLKGVASYTTSNSYQVYNKFQNTVLAIYTFIKQIISGKNGYAQQQLMGKNTTFSARNVISAPSYRDDDCPISVFRTGFPLWTVLTLFFPLVKYQMKEFLSYPSLCSFHTNVNEIDQQTVTNMYDDEGIESLMHTFQKNQGSRFKKLYLDAEGLKPIMFPAYDLTKNEPIVRPLTLTDVVYIACKRAVVDANRHVYLVRYPIGDYLGCFFTRVHLLSTVRTCKIKFGNEEFKYYPIIDPDTPHNIVASSFLDTITPSNSRLKAIGGDYDGDTVKTIGIWSDEANEEAERLMTSKVYCIKTEGTSAFVIDLECTNGLYALTKMG